MEEKVVFHNSKGNRLIGVLIDANGNKEKLVVLFVHGHSSSKYTKNFVKLSELLKEKGMSSFRIDLYGHGESDGKFEDCNVTEAVDDILKAIDYLKKKGYHRIGLLGSSFGGISSMVAASKTNDLDFLVLKSPVSNYKEKYLATNGKAFLDQWKKEKVRDYDASEGKVLRLKYSFYEDALKNDAYKAAPLINVPTLIVHGDQDEAVPVEQSIKISRIFSKCKLVIVEGSDHVYTQLHHRDEMLKVISEFIFSNI